MRGRDPHTVLKRDVVSKANRESFEVVLARLQWGKEDVGFSLHANPILYVRWHSENGFSAQTAC